MPIGGAGWGMWLAVTWSENSDRVLSVSHQLRCRERTGHTSRHSSVGANTQPLGAKAQPPRGRIFACARRQGSPILQRRQQLAVLSNILDKAVNATNFRKFCYISCVAKTMMRPRRQLCRFAESATINPIALYIHTQAITHTHSCSGAFTNHL